MGIQSLGGGEKAGRGEGQPCGIAAVTVASLGKFGSPDTFQFNVSSGE